EDMILAVFAVEKLPPEQVEFVAGNSEAAAHDIAPLLDRLGAHLGLDAISRIEPRQSHIPERASVYVPAEEKRSSDPSVIPGRRVAASPESMNTSLWKMDSGLAPSARSGITSGEVAGNSRKPPRPVRLFRPPEPIEAQWVLPDDPPFRFTWRRRQHRVRHADGPERIAEEWWIGDS